jgi:hypothetical protein
MQQIQMSDIIPKELQELLTKQMGQAMDAVNKEVSFLPKEKRDEINPLIEKMKDTNNADTTAPFKVVKEILNLLEK